MWLDHVGLDLFICALIICNVARSYFCYRVAPIIGCLICIGHFRQKSPICSGAFAKRGLQLKASYASLPPCREAWSWRRLPLIHVVVSLVWDVTHSHVTHSYEAWPFDTWPTHIQRYSFICLPFAHIRCCSFIWDSLIRSVALWWYTTHSYTLLVTHSYICNSHRIRCCSFIWDSLIRRAIHYYKIPLVYDGTHSYVCNSLVRDVTHSYVTHSYEVWLFDT